MRRISLAVAALAALPVLVAGHADAAKVSCKLITDPAGDAAVQTLPTPANDNDDLLSADLASNATSITAVVRVKAFTDRDPQWLTGRSYGVNFNIKGSPYDEYFLIARTFPQGIQYHLGHRETLPPLGSSSNIYDAAVTGSFDKVKGEIRITAPMSELTKIGKFTKGTLIKAPAAAIERLAGQGVVPSQTVNGNRIPLGGFRYQADLSDGKPGTYALGAPSCVKP